MDVNGTIIKATSIERGIYIGGIVRIKQFDSGDKSFFEDCNELIMSSAGEYLTDGGITVPESALLSIAITIVMLSLGTPGVPGASLVCLSVLLNQIGVPIEAIGIIMGVDSLLDMFRTVSNTTGDVAVTTIVAKSENLIDLKTYNRF